MTVGEGFRSISSTSLPLASPLENVVIVGASFAGWFTCKELASQLPSNSRIILIDRTSHHFHTFVLPRYSVVAGHEKKAFVPRTGQASAGLVPGIVEVVHDAATALDFAKKNVILNSGRVISYKALVIATGCELSEPGTLPARTKEEGVDKLRHYNSLICGAHRIAIVGAGALGVQLATDIATVFKKDKSVDLYSSRNAIMPKFPEAVQQLALDSVHETGVNVILNERAAVDWSKGAGGVSDKPGAGNIILHNGAVKPYDLIFKCTGAVPRSGLVKKYDSTLVSDSGYIKVLPTMQIASSNYPDVFVVGDVANCDAPKMARVMFSQSKVVAHNIVKILQHTESAGLEEYKSVPSENALHLTLGIHKSLKYMPDPSLPNGYRLKVDRDDPDSVAQSYKKIWIKFDADPLRVDD